MTKINTTLLGLFSIVVLYAGPSYAGETADVSIDREVDRYLEKSASKWDDPNTLRAFWDNAIAFESSDGAFKLKVGGRLMWDTYWSSTGTTDFGGTNPLGQGTYFRRVRLYVSGDVYGRTTFKIQLDFVSSQLIKDMYVGLKKLWGSGGTLLFGHQKEAFSLYNMTSSKYIQLMERPASTTAFSPERGSGVGLYSGPLANKRMTVGAFFGWGRTDGVGSLNTGSGGGAFSIRVTGLAIYNPQKKTILHLGIGANYHNTPTGMTQYRTRPDVGTGPRSVDTGMFAADNAIHYNVEFLFIWRQLDIVAEFIGVETDGGTNPDQSFYGWYVELGWWITGETKNYNVKRGVIGRTSPKRNFHDGQGGWGAWQIVVRYDFIDLNSNLGQAGAVNGGKQSVIAAGANWHWNPSTRVMFNLLLGDVTGGPLGTGEVIIFAMRFQFDF